AGRAAPPPVPAIRAAHVESAADKGERAAAKPATDKPAEKASDRGEAGSRVTDKPGDRTEKGTEKAGDGVPRAADKPAAITGEAPPPTADKPAAGPDAVSRTAPRARDAAAPAADTPPGGASLATAQARVADADH
ncbi:TPA: ribonuclease III, partial [Burkholderia dolosa]